MLGHIVSTDGIKIDPERVKEILKISIPRNKKEIQSCIGKIIFLRWFIPNFADIVNQITKMLRKYQEVELTLEARLSFERIKQTLTEALILVSPNFSKDFITFSFATEDSITTVLLQKNSEGLEQPISFFSKILRES